MCNDYRQQVDVATIVEDFRTQGIELDFPEGMPNLGPRQDIRITDTAPIVRSVARGSAELLQRRWSWPSQGGKPVYNFKSEGREFPSGRCLIVADGFYEFTGTPRSDEEAQGQMAVHEKG
jgi:putative SOS response-associated peptidase YedK